MKPEIDPKLDLVFERTVDLPPEAIWKAWTTPALLKQWFTPAPWKTTHAEIELRPGGLFRTAMRGPNGEEQAGDGCYLEVVENRRLVWTDALERNYRPAKKPNDCIAEHFTAILTFEPQGSGTKYTAIARHNSEEARKKHEEQGFEAGWGAALDQLVALMKKV